MGNPAIPSRVGANNAKTSNSLGKVRVWESLVWAAITLLIFLGILAWGTYFVPEQLVGLVLIGLVFIVFVLFCGKSERLAPRTLLDYSLIGILAAYLLASIDAVNPRDAVQEVLKQSGYLMVFWMVSRIVTTPQRRLAIMAAFGASASVVALLGLVFAAGLIPFNLSVNGGRIASTLQYANALGGYLVTGSIVILSLRSQASKLSSMIMWGLGLYTCVLVLAFTYSRGAWLVFPIALMIYWIAIPSGSRMQSGVALIPALLAVIPAAVLLEPSLRASQAKGIWLALVVGIAILVAVETLLYVARSWQKGWRAGLVLFLLVTIGVLVAAKLEIPRDILNRLDAISLADLSAVSRLDFYGDGLRIVKDYPVSGTGGGGWESVYRSYQTWGYTSKLAHSSLVQIAVESGSVGVLMSTVSWFGLGLLFYRTRRARAEGLDLSAGAFAASIALWGHSLIDFTLSVPAIGAYLWALMGLVGTDAKSCQEGNVHIGLASRDLIFRKVLIAVTPLFILLTLSLMVGNAYSQKAVVALAKGDFWRSANLYRTSLKYDPLASAAWIDLGQAQLAIGLGTSDDALTQQALRSFERGIALNRLNGRFHRIVGSAEVSLGVFDKGIARLEKATELEPFETVQYETLAQAYIYVGMVNAANGEKVKAAAYYRKLEGVQKTMKDRAGSIPRFVPPYLRMPEKTPPVIFASGRAKSFLGEWGQAQAYLAEAAQDPTVGPQALLWLAAIYEKEGLIDKSAEILKGALALPNTTTDAYDEVRKKLTIGFVGDTERP